MQLSVKYRPQSLKTFIGQDEVKATVKSLLTKQWPGAVLISGETGSGKTTLARIIAKELKSLDCCEEINIGDSRGIDDIRSLAERAKFAPLGNSKYRIFILDEVHMLTSAAASALLKVLEEPCKTTKFILCTDQPEKLLKTILGRCVKLKLNKITPEEYVPFLKYVCKKEEVSIEEKKLQKIAEAAGGQPRESLQLLEVALANPDASLEELIPNTFGNSYKAVANLIIYACHNETKKVLEYWSFLDDRKAACKTLTWFLEYAMAKMSKADVNNRWCWYSWEKQKAFELIDKAVELKNVIALYGRIAKVLSIARETTEIEPLLLTALLQG